MKATILDTHGRIIEFGKKNDKINKNVPNFTAAHN